MRLQDLLARLPAAELVGDPALEIVDVTHDSRRSSPGDALRGRPRPRRRRQPVRRGGTAERGGRRLLRGAARRRGGVGARRERAPGAGHAVRDPARGPRPLPRPRGRHRHERQDDHHLPGGRGPARGRGDGRPRRHGRVPRGRPHRRGGAHDARGLRPPGAVPGHGGRRLPPRGPRGVLARARPRPGPRPRVRGRGLHEPHPGPPRLPRRHGRVLRGQAAPVREAPARGRPRHRQSRRRPRRRGRSREPRKGLDVLAREPEGGPPGRGRAPLARRHALPGAHARGHARDRDAAPRPLQRAERARRARRRARPLPAEGRGAAGDRRPAGRAGPHGARRRPGRTSPSSWTTRTPTTRSRTCSRPSAGSSPAASSPCSAAGGTATAASAR